MIAARDTHTLQPEHVRNAAMARNMLEPLAKAARWELLLGGWFTQYNYPPSLDYSLTRRTPHGYS